LEQKSMSETFIFSVRKSVWIYEPSADVTIIAHNVIAILLPVMTYSLLIRRLIIMFYDHICLVIGRPYTVA